MRLHLEKRWGGVVLAMGGVLLLIITVSALSWHHMLDLRDRESQARLESSEVAEQFQQLIRQLFNNTLARFAERHDPADWAAFLRSSAASKAWLGEQERALNTAEGNLIHRQIAAELVDYHAAARELQARVEAAPTQPTTVTELGRLRATRERLSNLGLRLAEAHQERINEAREATTRVLVRSQLALTGLAALLLFLAARLGLLLYWDKITPLERNLAVRENTRLEETARGLTPGTPPGDQPSLPRTARPIVDGKLSLVTAGATALCLALAVMAFLVVRGQELESFRNRFRMDAHNRMSALARQIEVGVELVQSLAAFYMSSEEVQIDEFHRFVEKPLERHPEVRSLQWAPRVAGNSRAEFEETERKAGQKAFEIKEPNGEGKMVRAGDREEYFPIRFLAPFDPNAAVHGFDLSSHPVRRNALMEAKDSGQATASAKLDLMQGGEGFLLVVPIFRTDGDGRRFAGEREVLDGFCVGVFEFQVMVDHAFKGLGPPGVNVTILDQSRGTNEPQNQLLHLDWAAARAGPGQAVNEQEILADGSDWFRSDLPVGGRLWSVICSPAPQYSRALFHRWKSWSTLAGGLMLTVCVGLAFLQPRRHALALNREVNERTRELSKTYHQLQEEADQRRNADRALIQSQVQLQALLDNTTAVVYGKDLRGRYLLINRRYEQLFGISKTDILGRTDQDVFPPTIAEKVRANDSRVMSSGSPIEIEEQVPQQDGLHTYVSTKFPLRDPGGQIYAVFGISTDITERKRMEEALKTSQERYELVINGVKDGIWDWDLATNHVYFSPRWKSMLGYAESEVENNFDSWRALLHPDDRERAQARVHEFLGSNQPLYELEHRLRHKDGTYRWILARGVASRDAGGVVTRLAGSHVDVTERKNAEQRLRQANEQLTERSRELGEALASLDAAHEELQSTHQQLVEAEKLASLGVLAAGVAHEIRNPLTAIKAALFLLLKKVQPGSLEQSDLELVSREITRLEHIVRDFLRFARPAEPQLVTAPADQPMRQVQELLAASLAQNNISLLLEDSPPAQVKIDPEQIEQVLINLVRNAAEAMGKNGTITLRARLSSLELRGQIREVVLLEVSDTGPGIPPEAQKNLFVPFSSTKCGGTGLGLSIAARIVEKHGGVIKYETELNRGTTFAIVLPRAEP